MAEKTQSLLKPTMVIAGPNDQVVVKDVYTEEGVLKPTNTYVEKSEVISNAQDYIKPKANAGKDLALSSTNSQDLESLFKKGYDPYTRENIQNRIDSEKNAALKDYNDTNSVVNNLMTKPASKDAKSRLSSVMGNGYGSVDTLTGSLKTTLVGEVLASNSKDGKVNLGNIFTDVKNSSDRYQSMSPMEIARKVSKAADNGFNSHLTDVITQMDGVDKLVNCDPLDLKSMQSILEDMTGSSNLLGIVDIGAVTGTMATVLKFANDWGLPGLVKNALGAVKDKELKLKMLKNATIAASLKGDIHLTKYYAKELDDEANSLVGSVSSGDDYALSTISDRVCLNLLRKYKIVKEDIERDYPTLGNELIAYLTFLDSNWTGAAESNPFYFGNLTYASRDALKVMLRTKYAAQAAITPFCKQRTSNDIIRDTFPHLLVW